MMGPGIISVAGGLALATAAVATYLRLRRRQTGMLAVIRVAASLGILLNIGYLLWAVGDHGLDAAFRRGNEAALVLATITALVGASTHFSRTLRGLDGVLYLIAAAVELGSLALIGPASGPATYHRWFISHGLAFAVGAAFFVAGGAAGVAYLLVTRILRRKRGLEMVGRVPSLEALEKFGRWTVAIGFPLFTYGILTGICGVWHNKSIERSAWYLDPAMIFSLPVWLVYAYLLVSLAYHPQFRGRKAAMLATGAMGLVIVAFLAINLFSPIHQP